jgi:hypothetical protein
MALLCDHGGGKGGPPQGAAGILPEVAQIRFGALQETANPFPVRLTDLCFHCAQVVARALDTAVKNRSERN